MSEKRPQIDPSWLAVLNEEFTKPYMVELREFLVQEKQQHVVYPPGSEIFNAFNYTPLDDVKVVILGQDPYHGPGQAHGLCFSVKQGVRPPPSLVNIFKEIRDELGLPIPNHGELTHWAKQGVLLLNTVLTVRARQAGSHQKQGWEHFTDRVIEVLNAQKEGLVFVLWGAKAGAKRAMIDPNRHRILSSPHPSPFSVHRGFFGNGHFKAINDHLSEQGQAPIDWNLPGEDVA